MNRKKLCSSLFALMLAATTAVSSQSVFALSQDAVVDTQIPVYTASTASVSVIRAVGASESVYAEWSAVSGASGYNVYVKPNGGTYTQIDSMLIRQYQDKFRADAVGLAPGNYTMKIVPIIDGSEDASKAAETAQMQCVAYDRTGFAFDGTNGAAGAYKADGTLKENAVVLYITEDTKDTVSMDVVTSSSGTVTSATGLQNILNAFKKGYDSRPLCIRLVGTVTDPSTLEKGDLTIDGGSKYNAGLTIEGIGTDATISGFGLRLKNISNVEIRNIGVMLVDSDEGDNVTLQQNTDHVWVHNCDLFYGMAGSDSDQAKGDGAMDCKKSTYVTFSYNHFWDSGKCNLLGLSEDTTEGLYITYHHNWYDHSDSRHPRVRFYSAHVYNNYYDGNSKYGMGSTEGSSIFSENNYFRNCKYPMLTSMQGSDIADGNEGTFSGEDGGTIKSYGNYMEGQKRYVSYQENNTDFDAYEASSKDEQVPSSVKSKQGNNTYNNFDTSDIMYSYTADTTADVPSIVMEKAGRLDGGDFQWEFDDAVDDESYDVNQELMAALKAYKSSVVAIGSGFTDDTQEPTTTTEPAQTTVTTTVSVETTTTQGTAAVTTAPIPDTPQEGDIFCAPNGSGSGTSESDPTSVTNAIENLTPGHTIYLLEGTYKFSDTIVIDESNSGTADAMKTIKAYNGADVVFDFSGQGSADSSKRGFVLDGDYWHFYGFEITKAADNGMLLSGNNNKIERMIFNDNQDTGLQLSRYNTNASTVAEWPSYNLILNCTSKNNCDDETMENADGFAAKLTCGEGNIFDGCMAYCNSDDGWDLYAKTETGPIGVVTIQNCVAFRNGYTEYGEGYGDCDGNGFKLGGAGVGSPHVVKNCLAFENLNSGFTDNNNPKLESLTNCTSYNNGIGGSGKANYMTYRCTDDGCDFSNIISYYNADRILSALAPGVSSAKLGNDKLVGTIQDSVFYNSKYYYVTDKMAIDNGDKIGEIVTLSDDDFVSLDAPAIGTDFDAAWRNADGSINTGGYMQIKESSAFYDVRGAVFSSAPSEPIVTETQPVVTTTTTSSAETTTTTTTEAVTTPSQETTTTTTEQSTTTTEVTSTVSQEETSSVSSEDSTTSVETTTTTEQGTSDVPATNVLYGDVNGDGRVDITDAVMLNKAIADVVKLNDEQFANADCMNDGTLSVDDSSTLLKFLVNLIDIIPVKG